MKFLTFIMIVLLILLQYRLWNGTGSLSEVNVLKKEIQKIKRHGDQMALYKAKQQLQRLVHQEIRV